MDPLLREYLARYRRAWIIGAVLVVGSTGADLATPYLLREAIDTFSGNATRLHWSLPGYALGIIAIAVFEAACRFSARYATTVASRRAEYELRNRYFAHLETLDAGFFQRYRTGDLVARATNDLSAVRQLFGPGVFQLVSVSILLVATLVFMFSISPVLAGWTVLVVPAATGLYAVTRGRLHQRFTRVQEQFAAMADHAQETFAGERVVKAYAQEEAEIDRFDRTSRLYVSRQMAEVRVSGVLWPAMTLVLGALTVLMLYVGGGYVIRGEMTIGALVQFTAYLANLAWPAMALGWVATLWQQGRASLRRLQEIFDQRSSLPVPANPTDPGRLRGEIELRDVSLVLGGRTLLSHVSVQIPAGSTVAVVGPLGSGKSLLVGLLTRLWDPTEGAVLLDGVDLRDLDLAAVRRQIGLVPQETFLFSGTIGENVAFGVEGEDIGPDVTWQAVRLSRLESDLDQWPHGLETLVGERGVTLSGGQKQRTAIARAVAKDPAILILDDALSSVDARTEEALLEGLHTFMERRTSLVIAHRLSTIRSAERVIVLDRGRVVEDGRPADLIAAGGLYTQMYRRQRLAEEMEDDQDGIVEGAETGSRLQDGVPG